MNAGQAPNAARAFQDRFDPPPPPWVYARRRAPLAVPDQPRPALFLDRDGVINVDTGYLHRVADLVIRDGIADRIAAHRRQGHEVVIVTNQSGIGRGMYDWTAFETLHAEIDRRLAMANRQARIGLLLGAPFHDTAPAPYDRDPQNWRKPGAGMLFFAARVLNLSLPGSLMIGDSASDKAAAETAGVPFAWAG